MVCGQQRGEFLAKCPEQCTGVVEFLAGHTQLERIHDRCHGADTHVGYDERRLQVIKHLIVDETFAQDEVAHAFGQAGAGPCQTAAQPAKEAAAVGIRRRLFISRLVGRL